MSDTPFRPRTASGCPASWPTEFLTVGSQVEQVRVSPARQSWHSFVPRLLGSARGRMKPCLSLRFWKYDRLAPVVAIVPTGSKRLAKCVAVAHGRGRFYGSATIEVSGKATSDAGFEPSRRTIFDGGCIVSNAVPCAENGYTGMAGATCPSFKRSTRPILACLLPVTPCAPPAGPSAWCCDELAPNSKGCLQGTDIF